MKLANASFNDMLGWEIDAPLKVVDILEYQPSLLHFEKRYQIEDWEIIRKESDLYV